MKAVDFECPDAVPNGCYWLPGAAYRYGEDLASLFLRYPRDLDQFVTSFSENWYPYTEGAHKDPWGCVWRNIRTGIIGQIIEHPLSDWSNLENYGLPDPSELVNFDEIERDVNSGGHERYLLGDSENFFERLHWLRGFRNTLTDLVKGSSNLRKLTDMVFVFKMRFIERWLELDIDGIYFLDDWGKMQGLMISPRLWRDYFKPLYKSVFDIVKKSGKHVFFHSDGFVLDIIPDLIEIGVDALNVQVKLIGVDVLAERFSEKVCFLSDVDRQYVLPFGTSEEVSAHVKEIVETLSTPNGGLISWGEVGPDVPLSNIEAMLEAFTRYGGHK